MDASACANVPKAVPEDVPSFESDPVGEMYHVPFPAAGLFPGALGVVTVTACVDVAEPDALVAVSV